MRRLLFAALGARRRRREGGTERPFSALLGWRPRSRARPQAGPLVRRAATRGAGRAAAPDAGRQLAV